MSDVVQIAAAAPKGWGRTSCAILPGTVPPDSVPTVRAPRRSDGSGNIGTQARKLGGTATNSATRTNHLSVWVVLGGVGESWEGQR